MEKRVCDLYDRLCIGCMDCEKCDLDENKICDNCEKCLEEAEGYRTINIADFLTKVDRLEKKKRS